MTLITDLQYFSPFIFFFYLDKFTHCVFDQYEHFQKMSFMSRCTLLGGNGPIILSVPLDGGRNQKTVFKDVKILNKENWQSRHWKTITSCYNKSPWFDHYRDDLEKLYARKFSFLTDWNLICFEWVCDKLAIRIPFSLSTGFVKDYDKNEFEDLRGKLMPATINKKFPDVDRYPQVFEDRFGFVPNLSVLDYLFCVGAKG
jgi:hypothetical protein